MVFTPEREAGRFQIRKCAILEPSDKQSRIINRYLAHLLPALTPESLAFASFVHERAFLDKRMHQSADFFEFANEIPPKIDNVGIDVSVRSAAAYPFLQAPDEWEFRINNPVLRIASAIMENLSKGSVFDQLPG